MSRATSQAISEIDTSSSEWVMARLSRTSSVHQRFWPWSFSMFRTNRLVVWSMCSMRSGMSGSGAVRLGQFDDFCCHFPAQRQRSKHFHCGAEAA